MSLLGIFCLLLATLPTAKAEGPVFAGLFMDHAVLQRELDVPVWGRGTPGETVTVSFAGQKKSATVDAEGRWLVRLDPMPASAEGRDLTVESATGGTQVRVGQILVGDVWLCSGQSNMAWTMGESTRKHPPVKARLEKANNPLLRLASVPISFPQEPLSDVKMTWRTATPPSAEAFSAIGYLFGEIIQPETGVPIGIINSSRGGTWIENWTPAAVVEQSASCQAYMTEFRKALDGYPEARVRHEKELADFNARFPTKAALTAENEARKGRGEKPLEPPAEPRGPDHYNRPGSLFNGMIAPLVPYALKGVLWYQGEGNVWEFATYDQKIVAMIQAWRGLWARPDLPFLMSELAPFNAHSVTPQDSARTRFGITLAKGARGAGFAWTITIPDGGEQHDIHPRAKEIPGERFAALALARIYGKPRLGQGPVMKSWTVEGDKAVVIFDSVGNGLTAKAVTLDGFQLTADALLGFEVAGENRRFFRATAEVQGTDRVVVSSPDVPVPAAVRYAWADFPLCNLYNSENLAAYPFRTDDWPWRTPAPDPAKN